MHVLATESDIQKLYVLKWSLTICVIPWLAMKVQIYLYIESSVLSLKEQWDRTGPDINLHLNFVHYLELLLAKEWYLEAINKMME